MKLAASLLAFAATLGLATVAFACPGAKHEMAKAEAEDAALGTVSMHADGYGLVEVGQVEKLISSNAVVIDMTKRESFEKAHIPGAIHMSSKDIDAKKLPEDKNAALVLYCGSQKCGASSKGAKAILAMGYTNVYVYKAGIKGWKDAGKSVASLDKTPSKSNKS
jgi:rhodanese-related sulfurtransferase